MISHQTRLADNLVCRVSFGAHTTAEAPQANIDEVERRFVETAHTGIPSAHTTEAKAMAEQYLRTFVEQIYLPRIAGGVSDSAITVDDVLSSPPRHDLSADRRFWIMLAQSSICRYREPLVDDETRIYVQPALECFAIIKATYSRLTRRPVDLAVLQEAKALIRRGNVSAQRGKPVATHDNFVHFVCQGVFGSHLLQRCPREQMQMAAFHLLIAYCTVPPSEVVLGRLQSDALRWRDVDFYLTLWDPDEEGDEDDDEGGLLFVIDDNNDADDEGGRAAQAAEERQVAEGAGGQDGPGEVIGERLFGERATSARERQPGRRASGSTATSRSAMSRAPRPTRLRGADSRCTTAAAPPASSPRCCSHRWRGGRHLRPRAQHRHRL